MAVMRTAAVSVVGRDGVASCEGWSRSARVRYRPRKPRPGGIVVHARPDQPRRVVEFDHVTKRYDAAGEEGAAPTPGAVNDLSLTVPAGKICVLVGPSGCGKTTSLKMVNRLIEPTSGPDPDRRRGRRDPGPDRAAAGHRLRHPAGRACSRTRRSARTSRPCRACSAGRRPGSRPGPRSCSALVGLDPAKYRDRYPSQLSGGERQRVGVARALAADPPVMLMDEPFGAVDPIVRERLQNEFLRLQEDLAKTILFVTHDIDEAIKMGDLVAVFQTGGILAQFGPPAEILAAPGVRVRRPVRRADRGLKRLSLLRVADLELRPADDRARRRRRRRSARARPRPIRCTTCCSSTRRDRPIGWVAERRDPPRRVPGRGDGATRSRRCSTGGRPSRTRSRCCSTPTSRAGIVVDRTGAAQGLLTVETIARRMREGEHAPAFTPERGRRRARRPGRRRRPRRIGRRRRAPGAASEPPDGGLRPCSRVVRSSTGPGSSTTSTTSPSAILQHLQLTILPLVIGFVISLVLAVWAVRRPRVYGPVTAVTGHPVHDPEPRRVRGARPITGLSLLTAIIPLVTYTLLILVRNIVAGFHAVPAEVLEAADGMGYTRRQRLWRVELPLAVPLIIAGVRLATVTTIGLVTVVAVLGDSFGGLGQLITEGLQTFFPTKYLLGAVLSVLLAFAADAILVRLERVGHAVGPRPGRGALMEGIVEFFLDPANWQGATGIPNRLFEHLVISGLAIAVATAIALPVGLYIGHTGRGANLAINLANIGRAVPSYAVMVMILPLSLALAPVVGYSPTLGLNTPPDPRRDDPPRDPADPRQRLRRAPGGRPRPRRGRARDGPARAPDPAPRSSCRSPRRSSSAGSGPRPSRSSRRRRSGRSCRAAGSAGSSSMGSATARTAIRRSTRARSSSRCWPSASTRCCRRSSGGSCRAACAIQRGRHAGTR